MANGTVKAGDSGGLSGLLNNKMLLQYLAAGGLDISQTGTLGTNVNKVTQENISAQNYAKLLRTLLSNGGKMSMDKDNVSIKAPTKAFGGVEVDPGTGLPTKMPGDTTTPAAPAGGGASSGTDIGLLSSLLGLGGENPSASPLGIGEIPPSDLAGLTPQDISQALQFKFAQDETQRQSVNDLVDNIYKLSQIEEAGRRTAVAESAELRQWEELVRTAPLEVPGLGAISLDTWEKLPTDVKAYSYYAFTATQNGEDVLSFNEFKQQADPSSLIQYYNLAKEDPDFKKFYFESKEAAATKISIGAQVEKKQALSWVDFTNELSDKIQKYKESESFQNLLIEHEPGSVEEGDAQAIAVGEFVESQLENKVDKVLNRHLSDDGVMTWTVLTKTGKVETITRDLYK